MPAQTVYDVLIRAQQLAAECSHGGVVAAHLTLALLDCNAEDRVQQLLNVSAVKRDEMRFYVEAVLEAAELETQTGAGPRPFWPIVALIRDASQQAQDGNEAENQNALLLIALAAQKSENGEVLRSLGLDPSELRLQLRNLTRAAAANGNPLKMLDADAQNALDSAQQIMRAAGCGRIGTAHLLLGLLENRETYALRSVAESGVDVDELAQLTRAALASDGQIATAQIRLNKGAKRALERARDIVPGRTDRRPISPQALLWGLLPQPVTLAERWKWGGIDDPLARVWSKTDVAPTKRVLSVLLGLEVVELPEVPDVRTRQFHEGWMVAGAVWACWLPILGNSGWIPILGALGVAAVTRHLGGFKSKSTIQSQADTFFVSCIVWCLILLCLIPLMKSL